jgi:hypothetical protein
MIQAEIPGRESRPKGLGSRGFIAALLRKVTNVGMRLLKREKMELVVWEGDWSCGKVG